VGRDARRGLLGNVSRRPSRGGVRNTAPNEPWDGSLNTASNEPFNGCKGSAGAGRGRGGGLGGGCLPRAEILEVHGPDELLGVAVRDLPAAALSADRRGAQAARDAGTCETAAGGDATSAKNTDGEPGGSGTGTRSAATRHGDVIRDVVLLQPGGGSSSNGRAGRARRDLSVAGRLEALLLPARPGPARARSVSTSIEGGGRFGRRLCRCWAGCAGPCRMWAGYPGGLGP
jgi:hypothetical protein